MILTSLGKKKAFEADTNGIKINISHIAIGDGAYLPSEDMTSLVSQKMKVPILSKQDFPENYQVTLNAKFGINEESFYIKEYGIFLDDGTLFAVWSEENPLEPNFKNKANVLLQPISLNLLDVVNPDVVNIIDEGYDLSLNFNEEFDEINKKIGGLEDCCEETKDELARVVDNFSNQIPTVISLPLIDAPSPIGINQDKVNIGFMSESYLDGVSIEKFIVNGTDEIPAVDGRGNMELSTPIGVVGSISVTVIAIDNKGNRSKESVIEIERTTNTQPNIENLVVDGIPTEAYIGGSFVLKIHGATDAETAVSYRIIGNGLNTSKVANIAENEEVIVSIPSATTVGEYTLSFVAVDDEGMESLVVEKTFNIIPPTGSTEELTVSQTVIVPKEATILTVRGHGGRGIAYNRGICYREWRQDGDGCSGQISTFECSRAPYPVYEECEWTYLKTVSSGGIAGSKGRASVLSIAGEPDFLLLGSASGVTTVPKSTTSILPLSSSEEDYEIVLYIPQDGMIQLEWE